MKQVKAIKTFTIPEKGLVKEGEKFEVTNERAKALQDAGLVIILKIEKPQITKKGK
jgi:hypothetical protein